MLLTIDIGNTNITLGLYEGETRKASWRIATSHQEMPDEYGLKFLSLLHHAGFSIDDLTGIWRAELPGGDRPEHLPAAGAALEVLEVGQAADDG